MTIFYPDLSHFDVDRGVTVQPGTVAVLAKATHGSLFLDRGYAILKQQAANVGAIFGAYHWLNHGSAATQAAYCYSQIGATPVMVDAEDTSANSGFNGCLTLDDITSFIAALRANGGVCHLVYLPQWYWSQHMGSPDLTPLANLGVGLVSSNYTSYSDSGAGWKPYGGVTPTCWQYSDSHSYGTAYCDFNAFKGTLDEFRALITGSSFDMARTTDYGVSGIDRYTTDDLVAALMLNYDPEAAAGRSGINGVQMTLKAILDEVAKLATPQPAAAASADALNAAVLAAMKDPAVQAGLGAAIASHLHVS